MSKNTAIQPGSATRNNGTANQRVKNDLATGKLTVLSFRTLQRTDQISPSTAKRIRQAPLRESLMDAATHQLRLTD